MARNCIIIILNLYYEGSSHTHIIFFLNKPFTLFTAPLVAFDTLLPTDSLPPDTAEAGLSFSSAALGVSGVSG